MSNDVVALVLAAGASRRFGDADKRVAALPDGRTLLAASLENLRMGFRDVRVVIGATDVPANLNLPPDVPTIRAPNAGDGMGSSIADAFRALSADPSLSGIGAAAICLGDMPWVQLETLNALCEQATEDGITRPIHQGQPGHPVIFGRAYWSQLCSLSGDQGARVLIQKYPAQCWFLTVEDAGVLTDFDYP
ncbi:nucleotidyltransferase family protein [uncultured Halovibrio sp.]|uniref:nucleotidyltransferase family protein n=1 Tax=uncultured Halovibrio sp. TaxID=985049 RepID=UPI0025D38BA1|nr:nucleotidyltransferase family protein [uncultured Halovibrio sp.]